MHTCRISRIALSLALLGALVMLALSGAMAWGFTLTVGLAVAALAVSAVIVGGFAYVHDMIRAARWNAGHRVG